MNSPDLEEVLHEFDLTHLNYCDPDDVWDWLLIDRDDWRLTPIVDDSFAHAFIYDPDGTATPIDAIVVVPGNPADTVQVVAAIEGSDVKQVTYDLLNFAHTSGMWPTSEEPTDE